MHHSISFIFTLFILTACSLAPAPTASPRSGSPTPVPATATPRPPTPTASCTEPGTTEYLSGEMAGEFGVHLPPCFAAGAGQRYPVLYLLPGFSGNAHGWLDSGAAQLADDLIRRGQIPPFIIVTTHDTFADFEARFVIDELLPRLESDYQASPLRRQRAVAGGSLGGASAYHLVFQHPDLFASAGLFGAGAARGEEDTLRAWLAAIPAGQRPRVFLNTGQSDSDMLQRAHVLIGLLDEAGFAHHAVFSPGDHSYNYWISNFPVYFAWLAQDW